MKYTARLHAAEFHRIKHNSKIIETRLYDEKRKKMQLGDILKFKLRPEETETITTRIIGLLRYQVFEQFFNDIPTRLAGYEESEREALIANIYKYYKKEDEKKYGVIGIRFEIIKD